MPDDDFLVGVMHAIENAERLLQEDANAARTRFANRRWRATQDRVNLVRRIGDALPVGSVVPQFGQPAFHRWPARPLCRSLLLLGARRTPLALAA
jgi:hypothetical protein